MSAAEVPELAPASLPHVANGSAIAQIVGVAPFKSVYPFYFEKDSSGTPYRLTVSYKGRAWTTVSGYGGTGADPMLAPSGRWALISNPYDFPGLPDGAAGVYLVDISTAHARRIVGEPLLSVSSRAIAPVAWDDVHQKLFFATLPGPSGMLNVYEFSLNAGRKRRIASVATKATALDLMKWSSDDNKLILDLRGDARIQVRLIGSRWSAVRLPARRPLHESPPLELRVSVRQDLNSPPMVVAELNGRTLNLLGPDEALTNVERSEWRTLPLPGSTAEDPQALLMLPRSRLVAPPPLIVQVYNIPPRREQEFAPDGIYGAAIDAAQVLVARGYAVLWLSPQGFNENTTYIAAGEEFRRRLDAAIEMLANEHIIDPNKVALTGFSAGGPPLYYAITHPGKIRVVTAVVDDGSSGTLDEYLHIARWSSTSASAEGLTSQYGTNVWRSPRAWLAYDPMLNIGNLSSPLLMIRHGDMFEQKGIIAAFHATQRPLELATFPTAQHLPTRPGQQIALDNLLLDWMDFWLRDKEWSDPNKVEMYQRWRLMRVNWARQKAWEAAGHLIGSPPSTAGTPVADIEAR